MFFLLVLNTTVAIVIGIGVANALRPGSHASLTAGEATKLTGDPLTQLLDNVPSSLLRPLVEAMSSA
jgi:Na+/H+-dicarboxylate symporter